jgi:hypothetical protein
MVVVARGQVAFVRREYSRASSLFLTAARSSDAIAIYLPLAIRAAAWAGDADLVAAGLGELEQIPDASHPTAQTDRMAASAALSALRGERAAAIAAFREALERHAEHGLGFERASLILDALRLLGPDEPALAGLEHEARTVFEQAGAVVAIRMLDEVVAGGAERAEDREAVETRASEMVPQR